MANLLVNFQAWASAHTVVVEVFLWPVLSAVLTWVFRRHSEDEFARLPKPIASAMRLVSALGIDAPGVMAWLGGLLGRKAGIKK